MSRIYMVITWYIPGISDYILSDSKSFPV
jgi:hypothetical protein